MKNNNLTYDKMNVTWRLNWEQLKALLRALLIEKGKGCNPSKMRHTNDGLTIRFEGLDGKSAEILEALNNPKGNYRGLQEFLAMNMGSSAGVNSSKWWTFNTLREMSKEEFPGNLVGFRNNLNQLVKRKILREKMEGIDPVIQYYQKF